MALLRLALLGAVGFGLYRLGARPREITGGGRQDGLSATFRTREQADLAIEHLVQEHHVERAFIYVEPIAGENSAGVEASGGDLASGGPGHGDRRDAPLHGGLELTVPVTRDNAGKLRRALEEVGAETIVEF